MKWFKKYMILGVAVVLLSAMLQTYICSTFCSIGSQWVSHHDKPEKTCCPPSNGENKDKDCQADHMVFLNSVGQFHAYDSAQLDIVYECDLIIYQQNNSNFISYINTNYFSSFHPPPPKYGIPVLVNSFLI